MEAIARKAEEAEKPIKIPFSVTFIIQKNNGKANRTLSEGVNNAEVIKIKAKKGKSLKNGLKILRSGNLNNLSNKICKTKNANEK